MPSRRSGVGGALTPRLPVSARPGPGAHGAVKGERSPLVLGTFAGVVRPCLAGRRVSLEAAADPECARYGRLVGVTLGAGP